MEIRTGLPQRQLTLLEALLRLPAGDLRSTLSHVADLIAGATGADKIDAFLYDPARDSLVAVGTSTQPLSALQRQHGLDVLPLANGGRTVSVYRGGQTFVSGELEKDDQELKGEMGGLVPMDVMDDLAMTKTSLKMKSLVTTMKTSCLKKMKSC